MKKDYNSKKKVTIIALSLTVVCLAGGLFYYVGTLGNSEPSTAPVESKPPVETEIVVPEIKPESKPSEGSTAAGDTKDTSTDINVEKPSDDKPKTPEEATSPAEPPKTEDGKDKTPPKAPDTSKPDTDKNHEFTPENPSKPPEYTPEQTAPNSDAGKPKDGDKKDGQIYIEGFGWIKDEGGGSDVKDAPNAGTGKPVGDM